MKTFKAFGVASKNYQTKETAYGDTYTARDNSHPSTPLVMPLNPYNSEIIIAEAILEIGSGVGRNLKWIMENTSAHYYGIEPNESMRRFFWDYQEKKWEHRVTLVPTFEQLPIDLKADVVVVTFTFQHIGFMTPDDVFNVTDITKEAMKYTKSDAVWIMYEHDFEDNWIDRWKQECNIHFAVYERLYPFEHLNHRGNHHLIIFKQNTNPITNAISSVLE